MSAIVVRYKGSVGAVKKVFWTTCSNRYNVYDWTSLFCHPVPEHSDPLWFWKLVFLIKITMIKHFLNITLKREIILHWFATTTMWRILERNLISFKQVKICIWSQLFPLESLLLRLLPVWTSSLTRNLKILNVKFFRNSVL